ncbi:MAG: hypothetical protein U0525_05300 [Patescibacteria group bacterium]
MRWHEHPIAQTFLVLAVMAGVISVQSVFTTQLFPQNNTAYSSINDATKVAALPGCPIPALDGVESTHPTFDPAVAESDPFNNFGPAIGGLSRASDSKQKFESVIPADKIDAGRIKVGTVIDGAIQLVEAMTPSSPYANANPLMSSDGTVIKIKTTPGQVIKAPDSGRQISGSGERYVGMVMYATSDGVRFANSRNDKPTGNEGYNLYIWGINTDSSVVSNYRRGQDEFKRKCFPQFKPGDRLGTAKGDFIYLALRDNGDFVTIRDVSWWDGKVTAGQGAVGGGTNPTPTTAGGNNNPTPTGGAANPTPTTGGGATSFAISKFSVDGNFSSDATNITVPFCWTVNSGSKKSDITATLGKFGQINMKINGQVAKFTWPFLNVDFTDFTTIISQEYLNVSDTTVITTLNVCKNVTFQVATLASFGAGPGYEFQIVPANNAASVSSPVRAYQHSGAQVTPTTQPPTPTPTRATCVQPNMYYCATNNRCMASQSQCDGIPTNTPVPPTPTQGSGSNPTATPRPNGGTSIPTTTPRPNGGTSIPTATPRPNGSTSFPTATPNPNNGSSSTSPIKSGDLVTNVVLKQTNAGVTVNGAAIDGSSNAGQFLWDRMYGLCQANKKGVVYMSNDCVKVNSRIEFFCEGSGNTMSLSNSVGLVAGGKCFVVSFESNGNIPLTAVMLNL